MKTEIELGLLEGICIGFENVEAVYVPATYIHELEVIGIKTNKYLQQSFNEEDSTVRELVVSDWVDMTIKEYGDTAETLEKGSVFSHTGDEYTSYMRLVDSQDIVAVTYIYKDGTKKDVYVDYTDDDMYYDPNKNQENTRIISKDVPNGVHIRIASPETIATVEGSRVAIAEGVM